MSVILGSKTVIDKVLGCQGNGLRVLSPSSPIAG